MDIRGYIYNSRVQIENDHSFSSTSFPLCILFGVDDFAKGSQSQIDDGDDCKGGGQTLNDDGGI